MLKYYLAAQCIMVAVWLFNTAYPLPIWVTFLPSIAFLLHVGVVLGIFVSAAVIIGIMSRGQRKTFYN